MPIWGPLTTSTQQAADWQYCPLIMWSKSGAFSLTKTSEGAALRTSVPLEHGTAGGHQKGEDDKMHGSLEAKRVNIGTPSDVTSTSRFSTTRRVPSKHHSQYLCYLMVGSRSLHRSLAPRASWMFGRCQPYNHNSHRGHGQLPTRHEHPKVNAWSFVLNQILNLG